MKNGRPVPAGTVTRLTVIGRDIATDITSAVPSRISQYILLLPDTSHSKKTKNNVFRSSDKIGITVSDTSKSERKPVSAQGYLLGGHIPLSLYPMRCRSMA